MEREYKYFIENEKGEWYRFNPFATFKPHVTSSNRDYRCSCDDCTGNGKDFYHWTIDPLEAAAFPKEAVPKLQERILENKSWNEWYGKKITEHEFV